MLTKIIKIQNVGTFRNFATKGTDADARKFTLVHGDNGRGKSTLCAILRSVQTGDATLLAERKTLDGDGEPHVELLFGGRRVAFKDGAWSDRRPEIEIFDATFVSENVYSGDAITHDHKKNLCRVVIGSEGVRLAREYDRLVPLARSAATDLKAATAVVQKLVPPGMSLDAYIALQPDIDVGATIEATKAELAAAASAEVIRIRPPLAEVALPEPPTTGIDALLAASVADVAADAERLVRDHLARHGMDRKGEAWLADGLRYAAGDTCPLCGQTLDGSPVVAAFTGYFGDAYRRLHASLIAAQAALERSLGDGALLDVQKRIAENAGHTEFWSQHARAPVPTLDFDARVAPVVRRLRAAVGALLRQKLASPLEPASPTNESMTALGEWVALRNEAAEYNRQVRAYNAAVMAVKTSAARADIPAIRTAVAALEARLARHEQAALAAIDQLTRAELARTSAEKAKDAAREALDVHNARIMGAYQSEVNRLLDRIGAKFKLAAVDVEYVGGSPRTAFAFDLLGKRVDPGSDRTPAGTPCFRNTLSSGDRNTLALAFFIAQLRGRSDLGDLTVVFDDPFTSLDEYRQSWTCNEIRKLNIEAEQVIVLSHSLGFLKLAAERCDAATTSKLRIAPQGLHGSKIALMDLDAQLASVTTRDLVSLEGFHRGDHEDVIAAVRTIRPLLESHIRTEWPSIAPAGDGWLGGFLRDIKAAPAGTPLFDLKPHCDDLNDLNAYTSKYAHDSDNCPVPNAEELRANAALALKLVGRS